jgi:hypothetical protein
MKNDQFVDEVENIMDKYKGLWRCVIKLDHILDFYIVSVFAKLFSEVDSEIRCKDVILKCNILAQLNCINFPQLEGPFFPSYFQTRRMNAL